MGDFAGAVMYTPMEVTERALQIVGISDADVASVGGGSTIGLGKALSLRLQLVIPTPYGGSEVTLNFSQTVGGRKTTSIDPNVLPTVVLFDVDLTLKKSGPTFCDIGVQRDRPRRRSALCNQLESGRICNRGNWRRSSVCPSVKRRIRPN